jgi:hypothetical protein
MMMEKTDEGVKILSVEGFLEEDGVRLKYALPPITNDTMKTFYRDFIVQLCENIAQLDGAENLFDIVENADDGDTEDDA